MSRADAPPTSESPSVGRRIGKYTILAPLSEGGMARVYIAQRDGADHICVLKQLLIDLEGNAVAAARFRREAHVAAFLHHPNIARVIDAGEDGETFYIAMDLINGKDLESMSHELLRSHRLLPYPITLTAIVGILDGLAYAHAAREPSGEWMQVVHRDLSPRNMMLTFDGTAKVIDFGMAKGRFDSFRTMPGMVLGTLRFVSPEQALAQQVDARSDLYSVAVVLYEFLSGQMLVKPTDAVGMLRMVLNHVPPPLVSVNPGLPARLSEVVARGLAKQPELRWQSAAEFRDALIDAAPEWCTTSPALVSEFLREQFPGDVAHMANLAALGSGTHRSVDGKTRTVMFEDLALPATRAPSSELPAIRPSDLSAADHTLNTRTGLEFPRLAAATATVLLRDLDLLDTAPQEDAAVRRGSFEPPAEATRPMVRDPSLAARTSLAPPQGPTSTSWVTRHAGELRGGLIMTAVFVLGFAVWAFTRSDVVVVESSGVPVASPASPGAVPRATATPALSAMPAASATPAAVPAASPRSTAAPAASASASPRRRVESSSPEPTATPAASAAPAAPSMARQLERRADAALAKLVASTDPLGDESLTALTNVLDDAQAAFPGLNWRPIDAKRQLLGSGDAVIRATELVAEFKRTLAEAP